MVNNQKHWIYGRIFYEELFFFQNVTQKSHNLQQQQYFMTTYCAVCHGVLCGIGFQGYQCTSKCPRVHSYAHNFVGYFLSFDPH